jgi:hypothetical protein
MKKKFVPNVAQRQGATHSNKDNRRHWPAFPVESSNDAVDQPARQLDYVLRAPFIWFQANIGCKA